MLTNFFIFIFSLTVCLIHAENTHVPSEDDKIKRVWMAYPHSYDIWGEENLFKVQTEWSNLVHTVAKYVPVVVLCDAHLVDTAKASIGSTTNEITFLTTIAYNDIWMRDSGCVFRYNANKALECIKLNFNGWGNKQVWDKDANVADQMAKYMNIPMVNTNIKGEGGGVITDGKGTLIANWASWTGHNRNPGKSRDDVGSELKRVYGATKMIWFDGVIGQDITDDHIDSLLQFYGIGKLLVDEAPLGSPQRNETDFIMEELNIIKDANDQSFSYIKLPKPTKIRLNNTKFLRTYVNYLAIDTRAVITAKFGDLVTDADARKRLTIAYPGRIIEMLDLDNIYAGGGGVHCITQHEPWSSSASALTLSLIVYGLFIFIQIIQ